MKNERSGNTSNDKSKSDSTAGNELSNDRSGVQPGLREGHAEAIGGPTITDSGLGSTQAGYTPNELEERDGDDNYNSGNTNSRSDDRTGRSSS